MTGGRVAVFDCFSGIAGDMTLAALIDAGAPLAEIESSLQRLELPRFSLETTRVTRAGMDALHLRVLVEREQQYQPEQMREIVGRAGLPHRVTTRALAAIDALARAESAVHGTANPHFHEVGGVDALVDITGVMLALEALDIEAAACPVVTVGSGAIVQSSHGVIPASPGPAATRILEEGGFAARFVDAAHELVTPTGAAILAAIAKPGPATIVPTSRGAGAGTRDTPGRPNALRVLVGEAASGGQPLRELSLLEANIDDMAPALLAFARDRIMAEGAADAWFESIQMKKGRPATKFCVLVPREQESNFAALILRETTTLGVRVSDYRRYEAGRSGETVITTLGTVRLKVSEWAGVVRRVPEFDDVRAIAERTGLPALEVQHRIEAELDPPAHWSPHE